MGVTLHLTNDEARQVLWGLNMLKTPHGEECGKCAARRGATHKLEVALGEKAAS